MLYQKVAEAAGLREGCQDVLLDLYCGAGTIGLSLASRCKAVHGVEIIGTPWPSSQHPPLPCPPVSHGSIRSFLSCPANQLLS